MLVFEEWGKPQHPDKKLSKQRREPTTNSPTHGVDAGRDLNQANIGWRGVLIPYSHYGVRLFRGASRIFDWRRGEGIITCIWGVKSKCIWDTK